MLAHVLQQAARHTATSRMPCSDDVADATHGDNSPQQAHAPFVDAEMGQKLSIGLDHPGMLWSVRRIPPIPRFESFQRKVVMRQQVKNRLYVARCRLAYALPAHAASGRGGGCHWMKSLQFACRRRDAALVHMLNCRDHPLGREEAASPAAGGAAQAQPQKSVLEQAHSRACKGLVVIRFDEQCLTPRTDLLR